MESVDRLWLQVGDGDVVEVEKVIAVGVVVPFDVCKLFVVADIGVARRRAT